jgi:hypothetical protein
MNTIVLNSETAQWSVERLLNHVAEQGIEVQDSNGKVLAFVLSPGNRESLTYLEAHADLNENLATVREALQRQGGVTTAEMLRKGPGGCRC